MNKTYPRFFSDVILFFSSPHRPFRGGAEYFVCSDGGKMSSQRKKRENVRASLVF